MAKDWRIADVRAWVIATRGVGGNYTDREPGHWIVDQPQANPMSVYPARGDLRSGGGDAAGGVLVEIETGAGVVGIATGVGGASCCAIVERALKPFLVGADPRDIARIWDQMYRATLGFGRQGLALMAISAVDLALWDALGRLRGEPVYKMAGGATKERLPLYGTGPGAVFHKSRGFWGAKLPFPHGPADGRAGFEANVEAVARARAAVGPGFPLMVDCFMGLDAGYALDFARATERFGLHWIEEALHPDAYEDYRRLKAAAPWVRWATGEHEYTRYGFRRLIECGGVDVLQPDLMWMGGFTEALRVGALAAAHDVPVIPHAGGVYSYHFAMTQAQTPMAEYCNTSPQCDAIASVFGAMFEGEPLPLDGTIVLSDRPGWGLELVREAVVLERAA